MAEIRPRGMSQGELAELLREHGFSACSKAAVSLAERPKESGVQFTPAARKAANGLLNSTRRRENRVNGNKTTVWLDDDMRAWIETHAYLNDMPVGEYIRQALRSFRFIEEMKEQNRRMYNRLVVPFLERQREAAGAAATAPTARETGGMGDPSISDHNM